MLRLRGSGREQRRARRYRTFAQKIDNCFALNPEPWTLHPNYPVHSVSSTDPWCLWTLRTVCAVTLPTLMVSSSRSSKARGRRRRPSSHPVWRTFESLGQKPLFWK